MAGHPLNLALRFVLEVAALVALGFWGWTYPHGAARWVLAIAAPLAAAALWATCRVPGDGGPPLVPISGPLRLLLEGALFAGAAAALAVAERPGWALLLLALTALHYAASYDRVRRLLRGAPA